jgi:hypothetical protein
MIRASISYRSKNGASHRVNFDTPPLIGSCLGSFGTDCVSYDNKELIEMREPISFSFPTEK